MLRIKQILVHSIWGVICNSNPHCKSRMKQDMKLRTVAPAHHTPAKAGQNAAIPLFHLLRCGSRGAIAN